MHCTCSFNGTAQNEVTDTCDNSDRLYFVTYTWKVCKVVFVENFNLLFHDMKAAFLGMINTNTDTCVNKIVPLYQTTADCLNTRTTRGKKSMRKRWWDGICGQLQKSKFKALPVFSTYFHIGCEDP